MKGIKVKEEVKKEEKKVEKKEAKKSISKKNEGLVKFMEDRNAKRKAAGLKAAYSEENIKAHK